MLNVLYQSRQSSMNLDLHWSNLARVFTCLESILLVSWPVSKYSRWGLDCVLMCLEAICYSSWLVLKQSRLCLDVPWSNLLFILTCLEAILLVSWPILNQSCWGLELSRSNLLVAWHVLKQSVIHLDLS